MLQSIARKINIRLADPKDLPKIFLMIDNYSDEREIDRTRIKLCLRELTYIKGVVCSEYDGQLIGGAAGFILDSMFNDDVFFVVQFLYIEKKFRYLTRYFLKELEFSFLTTKVKKIVFGIIEDDRKAETLKRFLRMSGYKHFETHYAKTL